MAKAKVEAKVEEVKKEEARAKLNGSFGKPFPWLPPYPASEMGPDGEEVFVRATVLQEITVSGLKFKTGQQTVPCNIAHAHCNALAAPKE